MDVKSDQYTDHRIFSELGRYMDFYESLSDSVLGFFSSGTTSIINFNSNFYSSIQGTLESICTILRNGRINDAYALLRKYYDSVVINAYSNLYLQDQLSLEYRIVTQINNWLRGSEQLPGYGEMVKYVGSSERLAPVNRLLLDESDRRYEKIRTRCNSHMHYNIFANALLNNNEIHFSDRVQVLDGFSSDTADLFILHLAYTFFLNDHYMTSSDYVDALECGIEPEMDSQYWVAPFIQATFDDIVAKKRPDVLAAIKERTCMHLA